MRVKRKASGFTLLETLVVLVIVSLASTLIYQTSAFFLNISSRVLNHVERQQKEYLAHQWLVQSVAHLSADYRLPFGGVHGDSQSFTFGSLSGLETPSGVPVAQYWRIKRVGNGSELQYVRENKQHWVLKRLEAGTYEFKYLDKDGRWTSEWPGKRTREDLPEMVLLTTREGPGQDLYLPIYSDWVPPPVFHLSGDRDG